MFNKIADIIQRTGQTFIFPNENGKYFVIVSFEEYEKLKHQAPTNKEISESVEYGGEVMPDMTALTSKPSFATIVHEAESTKKLENELKPHEISSSKQAIQASDKYYFEPLE